MQNVRGAQSQLRAASPSDATVPLISLQIGGLNLQFSPHRAVVGVEHGEQVERGGSNQERRAVIGRVRHRSLFWRRLVLSPDRMAEG